MQAKGGLQPQDPGTRLVQPLQGHDTGLHCVRQIPDILFQVLAEQDHVHAGVDGRRDLLPALHGAAVADHIGGIRQNDPLEAQLGAQQAVDQLL